MNTQKSLVIANPCHENWNKMTPTEKGKFCQSCSKEVVDFTKKSKEDVIQYLENYKGDGQTCGQFTASQIDKVGTSYINSSLYRRLSISFMALLGFLSFKDAKSQEMKKGKVAVRGTVSYKDYNQQHEKMDVTLYGSVKTMMGKKISGANIRFSHEGKELGIAKTFTNGTYAVQLKIDKSMKAIMMTVQADGYEMKYNVIPQPQKEKIKVDIVMESEIMVLGEIAIDVDTIQIQEDTTKTVESCTNKVEKPIDSVQAQEVKIIDLVEIIDTTNHEKPIQNDSIVNKNLWIDNKKWINIYPNPSSSNATVEWKDDSEMRIELFDIDGKLVWSTTSKGNKTVINTANLPTGNYIVKLTSKNTGKSENSALIISR